MGELTEAERAELAQLEARLFGREAAALAPHDMQRMSELHKQRQAAQVVPPEPEPVEEPEDTGSENERPRLKRPWWFDWRWALTGMAAATIVAAVVVGIAILTAPRPLHVLSTTDDAHARSLIEQSTMMNGPFEVYTFDDVVVARSESVDGFTCLTYAFEIGDAVGSLGAPVCAVSPLKPQLLILTNQMDPFGEAPADASLIAYIVTIDGAEVDVWTMRTLT